MPLRVLHAVHDYLPGHQAGSELYVAALCRALAALGHHTVVSAATLAPRQDHGTLQWRMHDGVPVIEVVNNWAGSRFSDTYDDPVVRAAFEQVLDAAQPDVLHVHNLLNLALGIPAAAGRRGIAVVATLHDYTLACPSGGQRVHRDESHICHVIDPGRCVRCFAASPFHAQWQFGRLGRRVPGRLAGRAAAHLVARLPGAAAVVRRSLGALPEPPLEAGDIVARLGAAREAFGAFQIAVAPSRALADEYRRLGFPAEHLEISDYGFPPLTPVTRVPAADGRLRIGFAGTLVWHKGADVLLDAVGRLPPERLDVRIFGDERVFPDYSRALRHQARGLPVSFMGRYAHDDIAGVLAELDVLVVPSRWLENSPLVIHEAFMAGVPVVASAIGGIVDLLGGGAYGELVPPNDGPALAARLERLLDRPERLRELSAVSPAVKTMADDAAEWVARYLAAIGDVGGVAAAS